MMVFLMMLLMMLNGDRDDVFANVEYATDVDENYDADDPDDERNWHVLHNSCARRLSV